MRERGEPKRASECRGEALFTMARGLSIASLGPPALCGAYGGLRESLQAQSRVWYFHGSSCRTQVHMFTTKTKGARTSA